MAEISLTGDQLLQLLELVAFEEPRTTAQLAVAAEMNRTVAHRLLSTLQQRGYVSKQGKIFTLGPILGQMAALEDKNSVPRLARAFMADLAKDCQETVVLHCVDGQDAVVVEQSVSDAQVVRVQHKEGTRHSLGLGASGRAILAWQSTKIIKSVVTKLDNSAFLLQKLEETKAAGHASSQNELQLGVCGVAVPLREPNNVVRYSVAVLVPSQRAHLIADIIPKLLATQGKIEELLNASVELD